MTMPNSPIQSLSNELLKLILDHIEPDPDKTVPIDRRQFLSVESFQPPPPSVRGSLVDIGNFRRVNKRFAAVGAPLLFTRVAGRFSKHGLEKLEILASWPHLARHVKKFSYLLPYFYSDDSDEGESILSRLEAAQVDVDLETLQQKAREQREIRESGRDVEILTRAIASFTSLQLVQLLRVADQTDSQLVRYIRQHDDSDDSLRLAWAPACSHGSRTIGAALLAADVPWSRFSSPMLSPQSAEFLASNAPQQLPILAARLTCLALHFDDGHNLDEKMSNLAGLFRTVFTSAKGMQAIHLGFPAHRSLNLPLEDIFHNVTWDKLVAFGVQGWNLDAEEILGLVLRHKSKLKGLRLRDVRLKEGSMWKDVLGILRSSMSKLEWVSLRRIGYVQSFEEAPVGIEISDDMLTDHYVSDSESDEEDDDDDDDNMPGESSATTTGAHRNFNRDDHDDDDGDDLDSDNESDTEHGPEADELEFPPLDSPTTTVHVLPWCSCSSADGPISAEGLGDNGYSVSNTKRKLWERWVVRRCPQHDE